jgi:hypothetical protein
VDRAGVLGAGAAPADAEVQSRLDQIFRDWHGQKKG